MLIVVDSVLFPIDADTEKLGPSLSRASLPELQQRFDSQQCLQLAERLQQLIQGVQDDLAHDSSEDSQPTPPLAVDFCVLRREGQRTILETFSSIEEMRRHYFPDDRP